MHVLALPHTQTNADHATCAYTQKAVKFCRMMYGQGREIILYSGEHNDAPCDEHVVVTTDEQQKRWFGDPDDNDLERGGFDWDSKSAWWSETNARTIGEICKRSSGKEDLLLPLAGIAQQPVCDAIAWMTVAEYGVGYEGIILNRKGGPVFAAFESHSHRHLVYGLQGWRRGREYDTVIPNYFDPDEFPHKPRQGDYLLFVGRLIVQKGLQTACQVADALDMELVVAGPGATAWRDGSRKLRKQGERGFLEFPEGRVEARRLRYVGPVGIEERGKLMAEAAVTLMPTVYVEPFGGVAVESMMAGTPAVTTDFGAFTETVQPGVSGYRFQTLQEAVDGTVKAMEIDPQVVRDYAISRYSLDAVRPMYSRWFDNLDDLWGEGWTTLRQRQAVA